MEAIEVLSQTFVSLALPSIFFRPPVFENEGGVPETTMCFLPHDVVSAPLFLRERVSHTAFFLPRTFTARL